MSVVILGGNENKERARYSRTRWKNSIRMSAGNTDVKQKYSASRAQI